MRTHLYTNGEGGNRSTLGQRAVGGDLRDELRVEIPFHENRHINGPRQTLATLHNMSRAVGVGILVRVVTANLVQL